MGVVGLWSFLKRSAPGAFEPLTPPHMAGRVIAVDGGMLLTTALKVAVTAESEEVWQADFLKIVSRKAEWMRQMGATPVIVLDGVAPTAKRHAHEKRSAARSAATKRLEAARDSGDGDAVVRELKATARLTPHLEGLATAALRGMAMEVVRAPGEAEVECARLSLAGDVWAVATEDGDALVSGARRVIRGLCVSSPDGGTVVDRDAVLRALEITPEQLRWLSVLAGTDFHPGLRGIGCARAHAIVKKVESPVDELSSIVPDDEGGLHAGLREAAMQFGDWELSTGPTEAPVEEAPVEEAPVEEAPVEEAPVEEAPTEEEPVEEAPAEEAPVEEAPTEAEPTEEEPTEEEPTEEEPTEEAPTEEAPTEAPALKRHKAS